MEVNIKMDINTIRKGKNYGWVDENEILVECKYTNIL